MGRSLKKGPYVVERLLEKVSRADSSGSREPIKTWARACTVVPEFVGKHFAIHNGKIFVKLYVTEDMVGHSLANSPHSTFQAMAARPQSDPQEFRDWCEKADGLLRFFQYRACSRPNADLTAEYRRLIGCPDLGA
jgi:small subunit ribosomal protein S19